MLIKIKYELNKYSFKKFIVKIVTIDFYFKRNTRIERELLENII